MCAGGRGTTLGTIILFLCSVVPRPPRFAGCLHNAEQRGGYNQQERINKTRGEGPTKGRHTGTEKRNTRRSTQTDARDQPAAATHCAGPQGKITIPPTGGRGGDLGTTWYHTSRSSPWVFCGSRVPRPRSSWGIARSRLSTPVGASLLTHPVPFAKWGRGWRHWRKCQACELIWRVSKSRCSCRCSRCS